MHIKRLSVSIMLASLCASSALGGQNAPSERVRSDRAFGKKNTLESSFNPNTNEFFYPKCRLQDLKFGFDYRGKICFDIAEPIDETRFERETGFSFQTFDFDAGDLTAQQEKWLFNHIGRTPFVQWAVFDPETYSTRVLPLQGITIAVSANSSFAYILGNDRRLGAFVPANRATYYEYFVFQSSNISCAKPMHELEKDTTIIGGITEVLQRQNSAIAIESCWKVYSKYPNKIAYIVVCSLGQEKALIFTEKYKRGYLINEMVLKRGEDFLGGMRIQHARPYCDVSMLNPKVYILPDMDGNGANEIYIEAAVQFVLSIEVDNAGKARIREVSAKYDGP